MASKLNENYVRSVLTLVKCGTRVTRAMLLKRPSELTPSNHSSPWTLDDFLRGNKASLFKTREGRRKESVYFPEDGKTNVEKWDLQMICSTLKLMFDNTSCEYYDIESLRRIRNEFCHLPQPELNDTDFMRYKNRIDRIMQSGIAYVNDTILEADVKKELEDIYQGALTLGDSLYTLLQWYVHEREVKEILKGLGNGEFTFQTATPQITTFAISSGCNYHLQQWKHYHVERRGDLLYSYVVKTVVRQGVHRCQYHQTIIEKLDILLQRTHCPSMTVADAKVTIRIGNYTYEKELAISQALVKLFNDDIKTKAGLQGPIADDNLKGIQAAVATAMKTLIQVLENEADVQSVDVECVSLVVRCKTVKALGKLIGMCISGAFTNLLKPLEDELRKMEGYEDVELGAIMYEEDYWHCINEAVSNVMELCPLDDDVCDVVNKSKVALTVTPGQEIQLQLNLAYRSTEYNAGKLSHLEEGLRNRLENAMRFLFGMSELTVTCDIESCQIPTECSDDASVSANKKRRLENFDTSHQDGACGVSPGKLRNALIHVSDFIVLCGQKGPFRKCPGKKCNRVLCLHCYETNMCVCQQNVMATVENTQYSEGLCCHGVVHGITGMDMVSNDSLVAVSNKTNFAMLIDVSSGLVTSRTKLLDKVWDVAVLPENQAAVTIPFIKTIQFLSTENDLECLHSMKVNGKCKGIAYAQGKLVVSFPYEGPKSKVQIMTLDGQVLATTPSDLDISNRMDYVAISKDEREIYISDFRKNCVLKFDWNLAGFEQYNAVGENGFQGLCCMYDEIVIVCGYTSQKVHILNGRDVNIAIDEIDSLRRPRVVCACGRTNRVYISYVQDGAADVIKVFRVK